MRDTEHATSRTHLALGRATLCVHFNLEPHSPEGPENVKVKYPQFENSRLGTKLIQTDLALSYTDKLLVFRWVLIVFLL